MLGLRERHGGHLRKQFLFRLELGRRRAEEARIGIGGMGEIQVARKLKNILDRDKMPHLTKAKLTNSDTGLARTTQVQQLDIPNAGLEFTVQVQIGWFYCCASKSLHLFMSYLSDSTATNYP